MAIKDANQSAARVRCVGGMDERVARMRDLIITHQPGVCARYEGPRALLEDEGLIPPGFDWPAGRARALVRPGL